MKTLFYLLINNRLNFINFLPRKIRRNLKKYFRLITSPIRILPDFLIIGVHRSGTTTLYNELIKHPYIMPSQMKEVHFFDYNFTKNINRYKAFFPPLIYKFIFRRIYKRELISGEATPSYLFHQYIAKRVFHYLPNIKSIILLRNPIDRAYSHYHRTLKRSFINLSFKNALELEHKSDFKTDQNFNKKRYFRYSYLAQGRYLKQIKNWLKYFPKEKLLIIDSNDFFNNPERVLNKIYRFLDLPYFELKEFKNYNPGSYLKMDDDIRKELIEYFKPYNERLYKYLGKNFNWEK